MFLKTLVLTLSFLTSIRFNHVNLPVYTHICTYTHTRLYIYTLAPQSGLIESIRCLNEGTDCNKILEVALSMMTLHSYTLKLFLFLIMKD